MQIVQYVYFDQPGEKERLKNLLKTCTSELQLRKRIAEEFELSAIDASAVALKFKNEFYQNLNK